jgi:hypothetical protein
MGTDDGDEVSGAVIVWVEPELAKLWFESYVLNPFDPGHWAAAL